MRDRRVRQTNRDRSEDSEEGILSPYRVVDLTDEKGLFCGKLLGDLGADVIKVERPGGDTARMIGPFYHDEVHPEKSLFWWAFNTSKRGITLDIESPENKEAFKKLVRTSDFVIESFSPGYLDRLGLGYKELEKVNPGIILVSITPFGQTGPYKDYKAPDIVAWAMGGQMYLYGDADRPPIRVSHHSQSYLHAAVEAAAGALMALRYRELTGSGQHVDVSIQESVVWCTERLVASWDLTRLLYQQRSGQLVANVRQTLIWPCTDGYVQWLYRAGLNGNRWNRPIIEWMEEEGLVDDFLREFDRDTFDWSTATQDVADRSARSTREFFLTRTKAQLMEGALKRRVQLYPVATMADMLQDTQLFARDFWVHVEHPELGTDITYPGAFTKASDSPPTVRRRAPLIGEHNREICNGVLTSKSILESKQITPQRVKPGEKLPQGDLRKGPLDGIKVIDFGWVWVGPLTSKPLSDYGAMVVKIEGRSRPDLNRTLGPFKDGVAGANRSGMFNQYNTGKLSVAVNLSRPKGVQLAKRLVAWADVVVENFAGGAMERMGLGYQELKKVKPDIIMLSTCMQGQTGPHATHPGFGNNLTALSGFNHIAGWPDREPSWLSAYTDFVAPHFNVLSILAALEYRRRTGRGQYIDGSQYENGAQFMAPLLLDYIVNGRVANRMGNRNPYAVPHGAYRCCGDNRWSAIAVFTEEEWSNLVKAIGSPSWACSQRFVSLQARKENEDELDKLLEEWTIGHSAGEVMGVLQAAGVAAGVVQNGQDLLENDAQLRHRRFFSELEQTEAGMHHAARSPFVLSKSPCEVKRAPMLGEHNEYVLKEILGMSDDEIAELAINGALE